MPSGIKPQTCLRCVPPRTLCSPQQFNQHVLAFHRDDDKRIFCPMMTGHYIACEQANCTQPLYSISVHAYHYRTRHPTEAVPELPGIAPTAATLIRREREARQASIVNNNNVINNNVVIATTPVVAAPPTSQAVTIAAANNNTSNNPALLIAPVTNRRTSQSSGNDTSNTASVTRQRIGARSRSQAVSAANNAQASNSTELGLSSPLVDDGSSGIDDSSITHHTTDDVSSSQPSSSSSHSNSVGNSNNTTMSTVRSNDINNVLPPSASPPSPAPQRRRSPRNHNTSSNTTNINVATNNNNRGAAVPLLPTTSSTSTRDAHTDDTSNNNDTTIPPTVNATPTANNTVPRTRNINRNTRRNPAIVHVNHLPLNAPAIVEPGADEAGNRQDDADLAIRRRNNINRRNNRRRILHGNYDLLPTTVEDLRVDDDFELDLMTMPDTEFEEYFFGFHHPRLDTIHYSYVTSIQALVVKLLRIIIEKNGVAVPADDHVIKTCRSAITALFCLIMIIRCIGLKREANHTSDNIKQFLNYWNDLPANEVVTSILFYASKAAAFARAAEYRPRVYNSIESVVEVANKYMQQTKYSRAMNIIDQQLTKLNVLNTDEANDTNNIDNNISSTRWSLEEIRQLTATLHPEHDLVLDDVYTNVNVTNDVGAPPPPVITPDHILKSVKALETTASEGVDSWNHFHLKKIILHIDGATNNAESAVVHNELLQLLALLSQQFIAGTLTNATIWTMSRLIFIPKTTNNNDGYRPIAIGSALYRLIADTILSQVVISTGNSLSPIQVAVGIKDGSGIVASTLKSLTSQNEDLCILSFDIANAFNNERRSRTAAGVAKFCPNLLSLYQRLYGIESSSLRTSLGSLAGRSCTGVRQGDPLAMLFFCCSIQETLIAINDNLKTVMSEPAAGNSALFKLYMQASYADDLNICLPVNFAERIFYETMNIFEIHNFRLNRAKSTIFLSGRYKADDELVRTHFPNTIEHVVFKTKILGVSFGSAEDVQLSLVANVTEIQRLNALLKHMPAHIAFYLVKFCVNATASYLHRILKPSVTQSSYSRRVDDEIVAAIEHMVQSSLPMESRALLRFPCKFDGVGINAWHSFIPKLQYDLLQHRTITYLQSHLALYGSILNVVRRDREHFENCEIGFPAEVNERDYINLSSSTRSHARYRSLHVDFVERLRRGHRQDVIAHMENQHFRASGLLFGMSYIRNSFTKDALFNEALAYRLKVPLIVVPPPDPDIPPPRPYYYCRLCETFGRSYDRNTTLFEHCLCCQGNSSEKTHRHDATVQAIMNYVRDVRGDSVEVIIGDRENTNGDRGQVCDFIIRKRGRSDVKFDVTYTSGVDASQSTNLLLPAPLASIVTAENDKRAHYQRNNNSPGDVIPLAFSFSGYYLGPSFIAFCNTIESVTENAQAIYDYSAHNGIQFVKEFHPARRRLISEITRLSYVFIAKARIRSRQQVYRPEGEEVAPGNRFHPLQQVVWPFPFVGQPMVAHM